MDPESETGFKEKKIKELMRRKNQNFWIYNATEGLLHFTFLDPQERRQEHPALF
jgi:hypothetical protein